VYKLLGFFEKYGLLIIFLNSWALLPPDLSVKQSLTELDIDIALEKRSGGNLIKQLSWLLPFFFYIICFFRQENKFKVDRNLIILFMSFFLIFLICLLSFVWSDFKYLTLKRSIFQLIMMMVVTFSVFYSVKHNSFVDCVNLFFYFIVISCLLSLVLGVGFQGGSLLGWAKTKNLFGVYMLSAMMLIYLAKSYYEADLPFYVAKMCMLFALLVLTASKTSIALAVLLLFIGRPSTAFLKYIFYFVFLMLTVLFICIPLLSNGLDNYWDVSYVMQPDTLTGRGLIWDTLYYDLYYSKKLFLGYGYGAYFNTGVTPEILDDSWSFIRFVSSAHNGYIELLLQFGAFCSLFLLIIVFKLVLATESIYCYSVAMIIFLYNITESALLRDQSITWVMMIILISLGFFTKDHMINIVKRSQDGENGV